MRNIFIFTIILLNFSVFGQINIGSDELKILSSRPFEQSDLNSLKSSTTLFVYRDCDKKNLDFFKSCLKEAWDFSQLEFISYDEFRTKKYDENYSFFTIGGLHKVKTSSSGMVSESTYIYLKLWMNKGGEEMIFSQIFLYPTFQTYQKAGSYSESSFAMIDFLYNEAILHNWNPIFLKNYLQYINQKLTKSEVRPLFKKEVNKEALQQLKNDTLYVLDYSLIKFNPKTGDESERFNTEELLNKYPYPYKIVSIEEFKFKDINSKKPLFYLSHVKSNAILFFSVFNSKTGEILYASNSIVSYNLNRNDFIRLVNQMKE